MKNKFLRTILVIILIALLGIFVGYANTLFITHHIWKHIYLSITSITWYMVLIYKFNISE